jgi:hypothetical protein
MQEEVDKNKSIAQIGKRIFSDIQNQNAQKKYCKGVFNKPVVSRE